jgi:thiosulfate/3-mercaptopyruvate sulfurtransferase
MRNREQSQINRRTVLGSSLALGFGVPRGTFSQTTPASPTTDDQYAHPEMLIDVAWLASRLDDPSVLLVGFIFDAGHIPGSVQIDWPALEVTDTTDDSLAAWQEEVERLMTGLGIARDVTVVVYDEGSLFAARLWWVLHYLGHGDVRVLNGGLAAWREAGIEVEVNGPEPPTAADVPYRGVVQPDAIAQVVEVEASLGDDGVAIVDARTADEYTEGHTPGAVNINFPLNALPDAPKFWKPASELRELYEAAGVTPDRHVIPYCSTGVRSAVTYFSLRLIGYENVSLFTGSWAEWSSRPDLPVTTGNEP